MDNKEFPELEGEEILPAAPDIPPAPQEAAPVSEEMIPPSAPSEEPMPQAAELPTEDIPPVSDAPTEPAAEAPSEPISEVPMEVLSEPGSETAVEPAAQIPLDTPPEMEPVPQETIPAPEIPPAVPEIPIPETVPPEADPLFDMSILNDPVFTEPSQEQSAGEAIADQEYRDNGKTLEEVLQNVNLKDIPAMFQRPPRKGRPKRKKGEGLLGIPNILVTFVWLALILAIGVTMGRMLWVCAADVLAFGRQDMPVTITIYESDSMDDIIDKLYQGGLIRYKSLFSLYADISDAQEDIKPGIYDLNTRYDYHALVNFMSPRSSREVVELTIPEGYTCRQIFKLLEENRICTALDAANYAANGELNDYWFLENVERGSEYCLEGFLFPDTYEFYKNSTPREALQRMLDNFETRFSEELRAQIDTLNANVTNGTYGIREVVIVASLIEKESAHAEESPSIAGVIYNRLFNWEYPALLNIDAAIIYAQDGDAEHIDTSLDSPYNTYLHTGLTPTPIANPGLVSLKAALDPASHNYYYYVLNPTTNRHEFSTTLEEHDAKIASIYG